MLAESISVKHWSPRSGAVTGTAQRAIPQEITQLFFKFLKQTQNTLFSAQN